MAAGRAERIYAETGKPVLIVDVHDRPRWHPIWEGNPAIRRPVLGDLGEPIMKDGPHCRPYIEHLTEEDGWTFNRAFRARDYVGKVYLTEAERDMGRQVRQQLGPFIAVDPWSKHQNLRWPVERWQVWVDSNPTGMPIVQHVWGQAPRLDGVEHVPTLTFRMAAGLLSAASVYVRGESGIAHAAAALGVPTVLIWGSCLDFDVLGGLPKQIAVGVIGPACGAYRRCEHCQATMAAISPDEVWDGVREALLVSPAVVS
jgi:hypothetical protein